MQCYCTKQFLILLKNRPPYYALLRIFFLLLAGLPILFLGQSAYKYYLTQNIGKFQNQNAQDALSFVSSDFENLQKALHLQVLGLKRGLYENAPQNAIDHLQIPQNAGIEWYAANHDLLGWRGFYTPLDSLSAFPKANQSQMLNQGDIEVLETWMRVEKQDKTIAFIRVLQLLRSDAPFENADNLGFSLAEEWQKKTNLPIQINWQQKNIAAFEQSDTVF